MNLFKMETMFVKWISACICRLILFSHWTIDRMRPASFLFLCNYKIFTIYKTLPYYWSFFSYLHFLLKTSELRLSHSIMGVYNRYDGLGFVPVVWSAGDTEDGMVIFWCDG